MMTKKLAAVLTILLVGGIVTANILLNVRVQALNKHIQNKEQEIIQLEERLLELENIKKESENSSEKDESTNNEENNESSTPSTDEEKESTKDLISRVIKDVERLRGLDFKAGVNYKVMSVKELRDFVLEALPEEYPKEDINRDETILKFLGLIPENFDLEEFSIKLYSDGVDGLYDDKSKYFYLRKSSTTSLYQEMVIAHELTHALEDQWFDLRGTTTALENQKNDDALLAYIALVEGSATYVMEEYLSLYPDQTMGLLLDSISQSVGLASTLGSIPHYLEASFMFPYEGGSEFVRWQLDQGNVQSIDELFALLPTTTEQLLHPEKYPSEKAMAVVTRNAPDSSWKKIHENNFGEFGIKAFLDSKLDWKTARTAAEGWGGDRYTMYSKGADKVFYLSTTWDTPEDAVEFKSAIIEYIEEIHGAPSIAKDAAYLYPDGFTAKFTQEKNSLDVSMSTLREAL